MITKEEYWTLEQRIDKLLEQLLILIKLPANDTIKQVGMDAIKKELTTYSTKLKEYDTYHKHKPYRPNYDPPNGV